MGGTVEPEDTPGGGLTMVLTLPAAPARPAAWLSGSVSRRADPAGTFRPPRIIRIARCRLT
jgi:hypothetical protein